jgi:hypothetical protein
LGRRNGIAAHRPYGAVQKPGIQMRKTELLCHGAADCALARSCGTIDGDSEDHRHSLLLAALVA